MKSSLKSFEVCTPHKGRTQVHMNTEAFANTLRFLKKKVQLADATYSGKRYPKKITEKDETVKSSGLCANGAGFADDRL